MAGLDLAPTSRWSARQTRAQYAAIAYLRWRITLNSYRRKGGAGELVGRIILYLVFGSFAIGLMVFAAGMSYLAASKNQLNHVDVILWGTFVLCQLTNIQLGQPGTTFDPTQLIRFPMRVGNYIAVRLFFGLLSPANIIGALLSLAIAVGVSIAIPSLWLYALLALAVFAAVNALFSRMIFAWVDRWLSTRRAREVFMGLVFAVSIGFQYLNFTYNPAYDHHHTHNVTAQLPTALRVYHHAQPFIAVFPPGLISNALVAATHGRNAAFLAATFGCALFGVVFFAIFAWRMSTEFRGENLSDAANAVSTKPKATHLPSPTLAPATTQMATRRFGLNPTVFAVLGKEFLQVRRNTGIFYGMIAPVVFVFLFAGKLATRSNAHWVFPAALAYTLMGIAPLSYNSFGLEGAGSQFYFLAPVRLRDVFLAKNLLNFLLALIEMAAVFAIISYVAMPPTLTMIAAGLLWATATLLLTTTLGNRRSVTTPKKIDLGRTASKQSSPLSSLIALGILLGSAAVGVALLLLATYLHTSWILLPTLAALAAGALMVYLQGLRSIDSFTLAHRDELFEVLCKQ